jgi:ParB family chromosome partitioning protein
MAPSKSDKPDKSGKKKAPAKRRKKGAEPETRGLAAHELRTPAAPADVDALGRQVAADGGDVLATFRDPLGGHWQVLAALPVALVEPTPYQRDLSAPHVKRLAAAIDKLGRYLDPVIAVRTPDGRYWTPNGHHRLAAMRSLGARSIAALVVPEEEVARRILLLNTEKAHNLRERALEVARLAESIASLDPRPEKGAFRPAIARVESFLDERLPKALDIRRDRAARVLALEDAVNEAVAKLKQKGLESPYLKAFVVARVRRASSTTSWRG